MLTVGKWIREFLRRREFGTVSTKEEGTGDVELNCLTTLLWYGQVEFELSNVRNFTLFATNRCCKKTHNRKLLTIYLQDCTVTGLRSIMNILIEVDTQVHWLKQT